MMRQQIPRRETSRNIGPEVGLHLAEQLRKGRGQGLDLLSLNAESICFATTF